MKDSFSQGKKNGEFEQSDHCTLQGEVIRFTLGLILGLSEQEYTDTRNEAPAQMGKQIAKMLEDGTLKKGWIYFIHSTTNQKQWDRM